MIEGGGLHVGVAGGFVHAMATMTAMMSAAMMTTAHAAHVVVHGRARVCVLSGRSFNY
jgi:hypothetical protein